MARILILEDDDALRGSLAGILNRKGHQVDQAANGRQAVEMAEQHAYDLIVTDIRMEGLDGLEALERVKGLQPDIGSLVVTGYSTEADSIRAIRLGVGEYLKKPFRLPTFVESVDTLLHRREAAEARLLEVALVALDETLKRLGRQQLSVDGQRAGRTARELGLEQAHRWVQLATMLAGLGRELPEQRLPARLLDVLKNAYRPYQEVPIESRIVAAVLRLQGEKAAYDPEVVRVLEEDEEVERLPLGGLLSLARALSQKGDAEVAQQAFELVVERAPGSRQAIEALLRSSDLEFDQGHRQSALERIHKARSWAARLGPAASARTCLEAGLRLGPEGLEYLQQAQRIAHSIEDQALASLARLAQARQGAQTLQAEDLELLSQPRHQDQLAQALEWLLGFLLETPDTEAVLARWALDYPDAFARVQDLSPAGRSRMVTVMTQAGSRAGADILESLLADPEESVRQAAQTALASSAHQEHAPLLRLHSFGPFQAFAGQTTLDQWKTQKVRYLLARLASSSSSRWLSDEALQEEFWPDRPSEKSRKSLNNALSHLRSHLKEVGTVVERTPEGLRLNPEFRLWHDLEEFLQSARQASDMARQDPEDSRILEPLKSMAALYQGPYLEGCYLEWAVERRGELENMALKALVELVQRCQTLERYQEAVEFGRRALQLDPCQSQAHLGLLRAYLALGRPEEAARQYERCREVFEEELGLEPPPEVEDCYRQALLNLS